jgi:GNAT superfamily N-acetyltransferase
MTELIVDTWPPEPLLTERLVLRESREQDRDGLISLLPGYWGKGYAQDSVRAVLTWTSTVVSDEKVVAVTQSANERSLTLLRRLGFTEVMRFEEFGAEQSMNVADLRR